VRAYRVTDGMVMQVNDTGIGIAPQDFSKALEPFGQVDSSLARKYEGTGLGLPLTRQMVELHGGHLVLDSVLGQGTSVTVTLPAWRLKAVEKAGAECAEDHADQRGAHYRAQAGAVDAPVLGQRRRDKAHGGSVEAIEENNQETQDHHAPLVTGQWLGVDEGLHVQGSTDRGLIHCFYFHTDGGLTTLGRRYY